MNHCAKAHHVLQLNLTTSSTLSEYGWSRLLLTETSKSSSQRGAILESSCAPWMSHAFSTNCPKHCARHCQLSACDAPKTAPDRKLPHRQTRPRCAAPPSRLVKISFLFCGRDWTSSASLFYACSQSLTHNRLRKTLVTELVHCHHYLRLDHSFQWKSVITRALES